MKKLNLFKNLKSNRGATGTDIIIAATIIVLTIGVVSMIYVNTTLQSKNVTRTAGATRIATNILENIAKLSYDEVVTTIGTGKNLSGAATGVSIFSTKIPKGYSVNINSTIKYGSHTSNAEKFDLVRDITVVVSYKLGTSDNVETVTFNTVKQREVVEECNRPLLDNLYSLKPGLKYYPVKYVENNNCYVKADEKDADWYNYSNKHWATVVVTKLAESSVFDTNGKFIATINSTASNANYTEIFVWIPKFLTKTVSSVNTMYAFSYGTTDNKIISTATIKALDNNAELNYNNIRNLTASECNTADTFSGKSGSWVTTTTISTDANAKLLNDSKYGPLVKPTN